MMDADATDRALQLLREEEQHLVAQLHRLRLAIAALENVVPIVPIRAIRPAGWARRVPWTKAVADVLRVEGKPLHIKDIIARLQASGYPAAPGKNMRDTIASVIGRKARRKNTFTHTGRGMFGLIEWATAEGGAP